MINGAEAIAAALGKMAKETAKSQNATAVQLILYIGVTFHLNEQYCIKLRQQRERWYAQTQGINSHPGDAEKAAADQAQYQVIENQDDSQTGLLHASINTEKSQVGLEGSSAKQAIDMMLPIDTTQELAIQLAAQGA